MYYHKIKTSEGSKAGRPYCFACGTPIGDEYCLKSVNTLDGYLYAYLHQRCIGRAKTKGKVEIVP